MKLTVQHCHLRSTDQVDSLIEHHILALQPRLQIDEANVRLERHREQSPPFRVHVHLVTPGPDVVAEGKDHTLRAAIAKVMGALEAKLNRRQVSRLAGARTHRQAPSMVRFGRGHG